MAVFQEWLTPIMTSDSQDGYIVTYTSCWNTSYYRGFKAFNRATGIYDNYLSASGVPQALMIEFPNHVWLKEYSWQTRNQDTIVVPKSWSLQGSNLPAAVVGDSEYSPNWTIIHSVSGYPPVMKIQWTEIFPVVINKWKKIRIYVTDRYTEYGGDYQVSIGNLKLSGYNEPPISILLEENNLIKYYNGSTLVTISEPPVTESMFNTYGMTDIPLNIIQNSTNNIKILAYDNSLSPSLNLSIKPVHNSKIIKQIDPISFSDVENIDFITITASNIKLLLSNDNGLTFYSYNNNSWVPYELTIENIKNYGMDNLTNIPNNLLNNFILNNNIKKLTIAYALLNNSSNIDQVTLQIDLNGTWYRYDAVNSNYTLSYPSNNIIKIEIKTNGVYKINY